MIIDIALAVLLLVFIGPILWIAGFLFLASVITAAAYALWHWFPDEVVVGITVFLFAFLVGDFITVFKGRGH